MNEAGPLMMMYGLCIGFIVGMILMVYIFRNEEITTLQHELRDAHATIAKFKESLRVARRVERRGDNAATSKARPKNV
jgi:uncharacterized membrane-anchored protein YhcB (DUF1043 family)